MKIVLKNVNVFNPHQKLDEKGVDLIIIDGIISAMGKNKGNAVSDAKVFDLQGKYIVPGLFDMHVHLREPGREDEETVLVVTALQMAALLQLRVCQIQILLLILLKLLISF